MTPVLFETMRVRGGRLPLLDAHLDRLRRAAATLDLPAPSDRLAAEAANRAAAAGDRILRLAWSAGGERWSERPIEEAREWNACPVAEPHPGYPLKTEERSAFDRALAAARAADADEPLLATATGTVVEGARFALVWADGDALCYPDPGLGGLPSVGLARLCGVADAAGIPTRGAWLAVTDLEDRAIGLVNAARGLVCVARLDGRKVPPSDLLEDLAARFWPA